MLFAPPGRLAAWPPGRLCAEAALVRAATPPPTYSVGGTVIGLAIGKSLQLSDCNGDTQAVSADSAYLMPTSRLSESPGSFSLVSLLGRHRAGSLREECRSATEAETVLGPRVLYVHNHTPSGLAFVVNPGEGTAALHLVSRRLGLLRRNRQARQVSPTCGLPRDANFSSLPARCRFGRAPMSQTVRSPAAGATGWLPG
ncbi:hypothetical protein D3C72_1384200 [compost metagenome]